MRFKEQNIALNTSSCVFKKGFHWEKILGYTSADLLQHLEKTLPEGVTLTMALTQKNEYHIDHIIPLSLYTISCIEDEELKKCWHFRNLRIIEAKANIIKADYIDLDLIEKYEIKDLLPIGFTQMYAGTEHCP